MSKNFLCSHQDSNLDSLIKSQEVSPLTYESLLKVFRKSYNRIGGIISPNIRSTTLTLTGQAVCLNFHLTRFWPPWTGAESNHRHEALQAPALPTELPVQIVGREGLEPPVSKENGFTVRSATNYRLPPHYPYYTIL